ncbi:hypothetical protein ABH935_006636 [Catenulispora sp. GAS73]|uniref:CU044_2847 family protein n=1 Tax=Catenulispora sp. GAS73 TaxID=3156269 RepID=UPI003513A7DD
MAGNLTTEFVQVVMPTGETIWVHITADSDFVDNWGGSKGKVLGKLEKLDETIRSVVGSVGKSVARYSPARTEIEFGIEISGGTGHAFAVLANAHATASVKVKMTWEKNQFPHADYPDDDGGEAATDLDSAHGAEGSENADESAQ